MQMRVLSYPELRDQKGIVWSRAHVYRMIRAGKFPLPLKLGGGTAAWLEEEIDRWLGGHAAERPKPTITRLTGPLASCQTVREPKNTP
jgi:prophage regulatory protein